MKLSAVSVSSGSSKDIALPTRATPSVRSQELTSAPIVRRLVFKPEEKRPERRWRRGENYMSLEQGSSHLPFIKVSPLARIHNS